MIDRAVDVLGRQGRVPGLVRVGRDHHCHIRQRPHQRDVLEGVVRAARHAERYAAGGGADHHALIGVGNVIAHLLHRPRRDERRVAAEIRTHPGRRQAARHAHRVLLRDAGFDNLFGTCLHQRAPADQVDGVRRQGDHAFIASGEFGHRQAEGQARLIVRRRDPSR